MRVPHVALIAFGLVACQKDPAGPPPAQSLLITVGKSVPDSGVVTEQWTVRDTATGDAWEASRLVADTAEWCLLVPSTIHVARLEVGDTLSGTSMTVDFNLTPDWGVTYLPGVGASYPSFGTTTNVGACLPN